MAETKDQINIVKKPVSPTAPLKTEVTLEEARRADRVSGGGAMLVKPHTSMPPKKDYTTTVTPPPDLGIAGDKDPTSFTVSFNRFGQVSEVTFSGKAAIIATAGRIRNIVGRIIKEGELERRRLIHQRIIKNDQQGAKKGSGKK